MSEQTPAAQGLTEDGAWVCGVCGEGSPAHDERGSRRECAFEPVWKSARDEAAIWHEGWIAGASRRMSTDNPYHAARLTDTAAPEGCTCSTDPLDRMPLIDGGCPVHGRPAAPAAVEGVETVRRVLCWRSECRTGCCYPDGCTQPVEPETSEPEGGDRA